MVRGSLGKLLAASLSITGRCRQHQQQLLRRLSIHEYRGAELKIKYGISVPKGASVSTIEEVKDALKSTFPNVKEVVVKSQILAGQKPGNIQKWTGRWRAHC